METSLKLPPGPKRNHEIVLGCQDSMKPVKRCSFLYSSVMAGLVFFKAMPWAWTDTDAAMVIVALGDSTTAGTPGFRSPAETPPDGTGDPQSQYAYWVNERHPQWRMINRGIRGERSDEILSRFDSDVIAYKPEILIVLAGVNDLYQDYPAEWVKRNLQAVYQRALQAKIKVMACTILPYNGMLSRVRQRMQEVNEWIRAYSLEHGLGFCDTYRALEDPSRPGNLLSTSDGIHPDVEGYRRMGDAIADALESWLGVKK
jgi:lysophospholipase L1-like esterase